MKFMVSIEPKLRDLASREVISRAIASIMVALSGLLLYLDKVIVYFGIEGGNTFGFNDLETFVWILTQSLAPLLMIFAYPFRPYLTSFLIPVYCYAVQLVWIFQPEYTFDHMFLQAYAMGSCILFFLLFFFMEKMKQWKKRHESMKNQFKEEKKEILDILKSKTLS